MTHYSIEKYSNIVMGIMMIVGSIALFFAAESEFFICLAMFDLSFGITVIIYTLKSPTLYMQTEVIVGVGFALNFVFILFWTSIFEIFGDLYRQYQLSCDITMVTGLVLNGTRLILIMLHIWLFHQKYKEDLAEELQIIAAEHSPFANDINQNVPHVCQCGTIFCGNFCSACGRPTGNNDSAACSQPYYPPQPTGINILVLGRIYGCISAVLSLLCLIAANGTLLDVYKYSHLAAGSYALLLLYAVLSVVAICFGYAGKNRHYDYGITSAGLALGYCSLLLSTLLIAISLI